jgi:hypothetical protein
VSEVPQRKTGREDCLGKLFQIFPLDFQTETDAEEREWEREREDGEGYHVFILFVRKNKRSFHLRGQVVTIHGSCAVQRWEGDRVGRGTEELAGKDSVFVVIGLRFGDELETVDLLKRIAQRDVDMASVESGIGSSIGEAMVSKDSNEFGDRLIWG